MVAGTQKEGKREMRRENRDDEFSVRQVFHSLGITNRQAQVKKICNGG